MDPLDESAALSDRGGGFNDSHMLANADTRQPLSEGFLLAMQREREAAERAERAERERAAERECAAGERQLRLLVAGAMMTCASAVVCAVVMRSSR